MSDNKHEHSHSHSHEHGSIDSIEKLKALLDYMHHHNVHHAEELSDMKDALTKLGKENLVSTLESAIKDYTSGNEKLEAILKEL